MPRAPFFDQLFRLAAVLLSATLNSSALAQTASTIQNTASLRAGALSIPSNTVTLRRRGVCMPDVTPDGSPEAPSRRLAFSAPGTVTVPYTLTQRGTATGSIELSGSLLTPVDGVSVTVLDGAGTGSTVPGNAVAGSALNKLSSVTLAPGESRQLLLGVSATKPLSGPLLVNLAASCQGGSDSRNVTQLDAQASLVLLPTFGVTPTAAGIGDAPIFTLRVPNPTSAELTTEVRIQLPDGLSYQDGSAVLEGGSGSVRLDGHVLIVTATVPAGNTLKVSYRAVVLAGAQASLSSVAHATGTVTLSGQTQNLTSNDAATVLAVTAGVFDRRATLIGQVFLDSNGDGHYGAGDTALPGVRVLLSNGWQALTDDLGRYTFRNLNPGVWLVSLDRSQAPFQSEPGLGTRNVDVFTLTRADFALIRPQVTLTAPAHSSSVQAGPVQVRRDVRAMPGGGTQVTLSVTAAVPVNDVLLTEALPGEGVREFRFSALSGTHTLIYLLDGPAADSDPQVSWRMP